MFTLEFVIAEQRFALPKQLDFLDVITQPELSCFATVQIPTSNEMRHP